MQIAPQRRPRRISLTPMIDVVFLLLVFFMLASRFGVDMQVPLQQAGGPGGAYQGPPRLVDVTPEGVRLNGVAVPLDALAGQLAPLMTSPEDTVILRARGEASLQELVTVMGVLRRAGLDKLVQVE
ncbi:biopolymer transporter ExbD [Thioclava sp. BHET1]|nr:biopolymer transporter ExbD [Thioclava sp. BHET1]